MTIITTIPAIPVHVARPDVSDRVLAVSEGRVGDQDCTVTLTVRGLYLAIEDGRRSFGLDLNALVRALGDAVEIHLFSGPDR